MFRSRDHLAAWLRALTEHPQALREVSPRHLGDLSSALALVAASPHGGAALLMPARGVDLRPWLEEVRLEHGPGAIEGPWPVRVGEERGLLVGVRPSTPPTAWEGWEPDAWPVPQAELSSFDARRVQTFMRSLTFARPLDLTEAEHEAETLLRFGARRWFRGRLMPTVAGLVAFGEAPERTLPGCAVAIRWPGGSEQLRQGALPWVVQRVSEERRIWGPVPPEVARGVLVLAFAERAWVGPDAATPITLSVERDGVRLAIPTRAANRREQEDRAPGNPRLRILLVRAGLLPPVPGVDMPDNDEVLAQLAGRWPGLRTWFEEDVTWVEVALLPQAGASAGRGLGGETDIVRVAATVPIVAREQVPEVPVELPLPVPPVPELPPASETLPSADVAPVPRARPSPRPAPRRAPPIFHARPAAAAPPAPAVAPTPTPAPAPPEPELVPEPEPIPDPPEPLVPIPPAPTSDPTLVPPTPPAGPLTLDERKAQLRALFLQADRPLATRELAEALAVHRDTLTPAIKALIAEGWITPTDPNPRSPVQRYRRVAF